MRTKSPPPDIFDTIRLIKLALPCIFITAVLIYSIETGQAGSRFVLIVVTILLIAAAITLHVISKSVLQLLLNDKTIEFKLPHHSISYDLAEIEIIQLAYHSFLESTLYITIWANNSKRTYKYRCPCHVRSRIEAMERLIFHLRHLKSFDYKLELGRGLSKY